MNMKQKITMLVGELVIYAVIVMTMVAGAIICVTCRHELPMLVLGGCMFSGALVGFVVYVEDDELIEEDAP